MRRFQVSTPKCERCGKTAYPTESITASSRVFHRACFKCSSCKKTLNVSSYFFDKGVLYCKVHLPKATATFVTDSLAMKQALNTPKIETERRDIIQKGSCASNSFYTSFGRHFAPVNSNVNTKYRQSNKFIQHTKPCNIHGTPIQSNALKVLSKYDDIPEEFQELVNKGKEDGQEVFLYKPKEDDKAFLLPQITLHVPYETTIDDNLMRNIKEELDETLGKDNYAILGLEKGSVIMKIALNPAAIESVMKPFNVQSMDKNNDIYDDGVTTATTKAKPGEIPIETDESKDKKEPSKISRGLAKFVSKMKTIVFKCLGHNKADSIGIGEQPSKEEVKNFLTNAKEMKSSEVEDFSRIKSIAPTKEDLDEINKMICEKEFANCKNGEAEVENDLRMKNLLKEYNEKFDEVIEKAKRESEYEYKMVAKASMMKDMALYEAGKAACPNCRSKILFHGTEMGAACDIAENSFHLGRDFGHGIGTYMTESLDCAWHYSNRKTKGKNGCNFEFVGSEIYYDETKVETDDEKMKAMALREDLRNMKRDEIKKMYPDRVVGENGVNIFYEKRFDSKSYVVFEERQIMSLFAVTAQRSEYCVIWRDPIFEDPSQVNERAIYLNKLRFMVGMKIGCNIYFEHNTDEAVKLIEKKKDNCKIILISNVGGNQGGLNFVEKARAAIGSNLLVLFSSKNRDNIELLKKIPNALFSDDPRFCESYVSYFAENDPISLSSKLRGLKKGIETHYNTTFPEFTDDFLKYPSYEEN